MGLCGSNYIHILEKRIGERRLRAVFKGEILVKWHKILVEENSYVRTLILNRPQKLNALSYTMISRLLNHFKAYEDDSNVKLVILKGMGRAFSTGGDVAAAFRFMMDGHWTFGAKFYQKQLGLNYVMATYRKPQVSLINGIVMGGGAGASMHGKFRVVTENTVFAMPETSIGLFPDVGASYFLSRLPGFLGEYLGLTGTRLDGGEMLACGLATHFVLSMKFVNICVYKIIATLIGHNVFPRVPLHVNQNLPMLEESLKLVDSADPAVVRTIIDQFSMKGVLKESSALRRLDIINRCFSKATVEEILSSLEHETINQSYEWIAAAITSLKKASPISLKNFLRSVREGQSQDIGQCLMREYKMLCHTLRATVSNDFYEGYRAIMLDKNRRPKWEPSKLELVSEEMVDQYFKEVDDEDWEDLQLPMRNLANQAKAKL